MASLVTTETQYVGFWLRVAATLIDTVLLIMVTGPLILAIYDNEYLEISDQVADYWNLLISYVLPALAIIIFWFYKSATPGKMAVSAKIVDAKTGNRPGARQCIVRYLGYYLSTLPLCLGLIWVAFDPRKQGWHDKLAGTVVVSTK